MIAIHRTSKLTISQIAMCRTISKVVSHRGQWHPLTGVIEIVADRGHQTAEGMLHPIAMKTMRGVTDQGTHAVASADPAAVVEA